MAKRKKGDTTEPAYSLLYQPLALTPVVSPPDTAALLAQVALSLEQPLNERQTIAFTRSFTTRISLLWGPPGTGKTSVLTDVVLGWLEKACEAGVPVCMLIGSSNWNAIDNVLTSVVNLLEQRRRRLGDFSLPMKVVRVRGDHSPPPTDVRIEDIQSRSETATNMANCLSSPDTCLIVGSTWTQIGKMAEASSLDKRPIAKWFDLLLIDEASQVPVSSAAAYFLLLKETANVVLAGDHRQLGPIYGFEMQDNNQGLFDCIFSYMKENFEIQPTALDRNYRTNNEISGWPKARFYSEGYEAFHPRRRLGIILPGSCDDPPDGWPTSLPWSSHLLRILDPNLPVVVITYDTLPYTLSNPFEAQMVAALTNLYRLALMQSTGCLGDKEFWQQRLGIVTPHRAQMSNIRNFLVETSSTPVDSLAAIDTVDRFQGQERDLIIASYAVADRDFVRSEEEFILNPRRFNVTLTRARSKFVMFVNNAIIQHLPTDSKIAENAAHLQLFVENYCSFTKESITLPFFDNGLMYNIECHLRSCNTDC